MSPGPVRPLLLKGRRLDTDTHRGNHAKTLGEDSRVHTTERGLGRSQACRPSPQTSSLQNCETINVYLLRHPVSGPSSRQLKLTHTDSNNLLARPPHVAVTRATFLRSPSFLCTDSVLPRTHLIPDSPCGRSVSSICFTGTLLLKLSKPADGWKTYACMCTHMPRHTPTHCSCREKHGPNRVSENAKLQTRPLDINE